MIGLKVTVLFVILAEAHDLVAPDNKGALHWDEIRSCQLLRMFHDSVGVLSNLPDDAITSSDEHSENHSARYSRIGAEKVDGKSHAWCGDMGESNEIMVDMTTSSLVTGVATQGRGDTTHQWVTKYLIETSENGQEWINHGFFEGNFDDETICQSRFDYPVIARFVKLSVVKYEDHPCTRWDVLAYKKL